MFAEKRFMVKGLIFATLEAARAYIAYEKLDIEPTEIHVIKDELPKVVSGPLARYVDEDHRERY